MDQELIVLYQRAINCPIDALAREVLNLAERVSQNPRVSYRVKGSQELAKKMDLKKTESIFDIDDVYGMRILVFSVEEVYAVMTVIRKSFPSFLDHDYIATPKTRFDKPHLIGKCLRLLQVIAYRNAIPFEVQVTTFEFNNMNESLHDEYHREKYNLPTTG